MSKTTHIICILDRSTSMGGQQEEVIRNFNKFLEEQQSIEGKAKLTLALFDTNYELVYDRVKLSEAKPLNKETFRIQGCTAMNDAIGKTLTKMLDKEKAIVLIHTDGYENSSQKYSAEHVKEMVDSLKKKWEFIFVGGGIDARATADTFGIRKAAAVSNTLYGTENTYANFSNTTTAYRSGGLIASANVNLVEDGNFAEDDNINWDTIAAGTDASSDTVTTTDASDKLKDLDIDTLFDNQK
jgi:hypothetical protein